MNRSKLKILIVDDHPLFRHGLRQAVQAEYPCLLDEAANGDTALKLIRTAKPDLCILDINMPGMDGLTVVRQMRQQSLPGEIIFLTMHKEEDLFDAAIELGVKGYVLKDCALSEIIEAIQRVAAGHRYISPALADYLLTRRATAQALAGEKPGLARLTPAERRVLKLVAEDRTSKEIAEVLGLSPRTIENHRSSICAKLDVHGIHSLVKFAFHNRASL